MNKVILSGNIVKDIETRHINDKKVLNNTIAVRRYKDTTDFINFVAWEKNAKFLEDYAKKGDKILIEGELQTRTYESKDGNKVNTFEIQVSNVELLTKKEVKEEQEGKEIDVDYANHLADDYEITDDDLPF